MRGVQPPFDDDRDSLVAALDRTPPLTDVAAGWQTVRSAVEEVSRDERTPG